jgi:hypothetical protein
LKSVEKLKIETWLCSDPAVAWIAVNNNWSRSRRFRSDFWFKTLARFYSLYEYLLSNPDDSILHVEADVLLLDNFPFRKFSSLKKCLAYPMKSNFEGIASTLYVSDLYVLKQFIQMIEEFTAENGSITDVEALGKFNSSHPEISFTLPSALPISQINPNLNSKIVKNLSRNIDFFEGIFDASTLGIYFTGEDPRNAGGFLKLFSNLDHPIPVQSYKFSYRNNRLMVSSDEFEEELFSLHVHSKDMRLFSRDTIPNRINYLVKSQINGQKLEIVGMRTLRIKMWNLILHFYLFIKRVIS